MSVAETIQPGDGGREAPDAVLRALADPHRRTMLKLVRSNELAVGQIATHFPITQQAVSQHLHVLERAGLLTERRDGTKRLYSFRPESLDAVRNVLADLWPEALERLKHVVEQAKSKNQGQTKA
jgi:DNA-binding transcriptional ArsR family regulator